MKTALSRISTKELATLAHRVIEASKSQKYQIVENNPLLQEVEKQYAIYEKVYSKKMFSGKGVEVKEADEKRDELFSKMRNFLKGYIEIDTMPNAQQAKEVYEVFQDFGKNLLRLNYAEETAQLSKLIATLDSPENKEKLTALNLADFFEILKTAQADFELLYNEQAEANAELRNLPSATAIRKTLEQTLRSYFALLSAMKTIEGWNLLYNEINEIVKGVN